MSRARSYLNATSLWSCCCQEGDKPAHLGWNLTEPLHSWRTIGAVAQVNLLQLAHPRQNSLWNIVEHGPVTFASRCAYLQSTSSEHNTGAGDSQCTAILAESRAMRKLAGFQFPACRRLGS